MGWFSDSNSHWDPGNWNSIRDTPILGDAWKGVFGDPDSVKAAYDKQIAAAQTQQQQLQQFLMAQKGQAQAFYRPVQHMFNKTYGTEGIQGPQIPQAAGSRGGSY